MALVLPLRGPGRRNAFQFSAFSVKSLPAGAAREADIYLFVPGVVQGRV
jgi:hypothetical protein